MNPLKHKFFQIFIDYVPEGQTDEQTLKEINRRGKIDNVKIVKALLLVVNELETLVSSKTQK